MPSLHDWPHVSTPQQIRDRSKRLAREHRSMMSALVDIRVERGMTQRDVAEIMGVAQQRVSALEAYDANPSLESIRRYANAVGAVFHTAVILDDPLDGHGSVEGTIEGTCQEHLHSAR